MKRFQYLVLISATILLAITACSDDSGSDFDIGSAYFPLETGFWVEYKLDSVIYDDFDNSVTEKEHFIRFEVGEQLVDGVGQNLTEIKRFIKGTNPDDEFALQSVWFAKIENGVLETIEENLRFIKLDLPPVSGKTWEGNQFIFPDGGDNPNTSTEFYQNWDYFYEEVGVPYSTGDFSFDDAVLVSQVDEVGGPGSISHYVAYEWYAKDVGIVRKHMEIIEENCGDTENDPQCIDNRPRPVLERQFYRKGFFLDWYLVDYKRD